MMARDQRLRVTGERYVPDDIRTLAEHVGLLRHVFVYEHVRKRLNASDRVIEIGSGEGYGTHLLSQECREIIGIDVESKVVDHATGKYGSQKCTFMLYDGSSIPFPDGSFDIAVSFQVIEHIRDDGAFIAEACRVLKTGGRFYITTPNRATRLKPGQRPWNRFHVREYYSGELENLLQTSFGEAKVLGISATDEIRRMEADRIRPGLILSLGLRFGLRRMIPETIDAFLARLRGRLQGRWKTKDAGEDFKDRYSLDDFRVEEIRVEESLDLFGICRRT